MFPVNILYFWQISCFYMIGYTTRSDWQKLIVYRPSEAASTTSFPDYRSRNLCFITYSPLFPLSSSLSSCPPCRPVMFLLSAPTCGLWVLRKGRGRLWRCRQPSLSGATGMNARLCPPLSHVFISCPPLHSSSSLCPPQTYTDTLMPSLGAPLHKWPR